MTEHNDNNPLPLAGAHCPKCDEVCVYEISDELARSALETIQIACHACGHIFKTTIPDDVRMLSDTQSEEAPSDTAENFDQDETIILDNADKVEWPVATPSNRPWKKYGLIGGAGVLVLAIGFSVMIMQTSSMRKNSLAELEQAAVPKPITAEETTVASPQVTETQVTETPISDEVQPAAPATNPDQFEISDRGYTLNTTDLGTVMNIKVSVFNKGDTAAKPHKMLVNLLSEDGVVLMTWPMVSANSPNRDEIPPKSSRQYSAQLIEPPQGAATLEVKIQ